jgi:hypothetical protein
VTEYRIVKDLYDGFEVQIKHGWWWPFWRQPIVNTHKSIEEAKKWVVWHAKPEILYLGKVYTKDGSNRR